MIRALIVVRRRPIERFARRSVFTRLLALASLDRIDAIGVAFVARVADKQNQKKT
mgnify:CR=1 FL=1